MKNYTLLTGATGLLGRYLVRDLLLADHRLAVMVRPTEKTSVRKRMEGILQMWEREGYGPLPRPICLEGDLAQSGLGLDLAARRWVQDHCDQVLHNAAAVKFRSSEDNEPWRSNLEGTKQLLELCREAGVRDFHHVSTAYVCGAQTGTVYEELLDAGQEFHNDYEQSKFLAEKAILEAEHLDRATIYRPPVIAGDSQTGYTSTYHGIYVYFRLLAMFLPMIEPDADGVRRVPFKVNFRNDERRNVVPVDWVAAVITRLFSTPAAHGKIYHLAPAEPITPRELIEYSSKFYDAKSIEFQKDDDPAEDEHAELKSMVRDYLADYEPYDTTDPTFDTSNMLRFAADLPCPKIDEQVIRRYLEFAENDKWGKVREARPKLALGWAADFFPEHLAADLQAGNGHLPREAFGLDVLGAGGGQWSIYVDPEKGAYRTRGLPKNGAPVLRLQTEQFAELYRAPLTDTGKLQRFVTAGRLDKEVLESMADAIFGAASG